MRTVSAVVRFARFMSTADGLSVHGPSVDSPSVDGPSVDGMSVDSPSVNGPSFIILRWKALQ